MQVKQQGLSYTPYTPYNSQQQQQSKPYKAYNSQQQQSQQPYKPQQQQSTPYNPQQQQSTPYKPQQQQSKPYKQYNSQQQQSKPYKPQRQPLQPYTPYNSQQQQPQKRQQPQQQQSQPYKPYNSQQQQSKPYQPQQPQQPQQPYQQQGSLNLDKIIQQLASQRHVQTKKGVNIPEDQIYQIISKARQLFLKQPIFLELYAPVTVVGDIHGQFYDLLRLLEKGGNPAKTNYLFLGDYVDRGKFSIECCVLLFAYKVKYPENFFLLRGNHETASISQLYGFYDECKRRYSIKLWKTFVDCFKCLPIAGVIDDKILCMHGGLSPELQSISQITKIQRPVEVGNTGLLADILWSDPEPDIRGWQKSKRGVSFVFGSDIIDHFLKKEQLDLICRAHQVVEDGYEFFSGRKLVTIFSAPNYCGTFDNAGIFIQTISIFIHTGALMKVSTNLMCSFQIIKSESEGLTLKW